MMPAAARLRNQYPYRMKDLCELTGLSRQAIHFYVQQGLVPPGKKTGRNMAYYGQEHVDRLLLVRRLQHERFLPLKAIKALLEDETEHFSPEQRQMLRSLKARLADSELGLADVPATVDVSEPSARHGVELSEIHRMAELGLIAVAGAGKRTRIAASDVWIVELWGEIRRLGFTEELGFRVDDLGIYEEAMSALFAREKSMLVERLGQLSPERAAEMIEKALPLVHTFLVRYHAAQVRNFFAAVE